MRGSLRRATAVLAAIAVAACACLAIAGSASALPAKFHGLGYTVGDEDDLNYTQWSGSEYFRYPVSMTLVKANGWKSTEDVFARAKSHGITVIPILQRATGGSSERSMPTEAQFPEWTQFVKEAVQRLGRLGSFWGGQSNSLAPIAWEVWNEPNRGENGNAAKQADPEAFTRLLKVTHDAIASVDPGATVLLGGLYWNAQTGFEGNGAYNMSGEEFLGKVRTAEALLYGQSGQNFDGLSLHPYAFGEKKPGESSNERNARLINRVTDSIKEARVALNLFGGGSGKGIWITELGWPTPGPGWESNTSPWGVSEDDQDSLLHDSFLMIAGMQSTYNIQSLVWYNAQDSGQSSWDQHSGVVNAGGGYKKAWGTLMEQAGGGYGTTTTATRWTLNGQPGWVNLEGSVTAIGGPPINNAFVNIDLQKYENGWQHNTYLHPNLSNSQYVQSNFGVGTGKWRFKTYFPAQGPFRKSESEWVEFEIKDGWQLESRYSGKCLDVSNVSTANQALFHQWDCLNPATQQNQVFTLVPQGGGYYQIVARHSGRCADVVSAEQKDGALVQQYTCLGSNQPNQIWQLVTVGEYFNLVAKHSGKCLDVAGPTINNGASVQQWTCLGANQFNQLWRLRSVNSADIPTSTSIGITSVVNGTPGSVSVNGHVEAGAYPIGGQYVNVNYQKWENGAWETKFSNHPTLDGNGNYSKNGQGVGVGSWRVRTVYPGSSGQHLAESISEYKGFTIK